MSIPPTPQAAGFHQPAEWEDHECCWMAWPHEGPTWRGSLNQAKATLARLARTIASYEPVRLLVHPDDLPAVADLIEGGIEPVPLAPSDAWARDTLPNFLLDAEGHPGALCWKFNVWGEPDWPGFDNDKTLATRLADYLAWPTFHAPLVNEGGALLNDGEGTLWAIRATLLNPNRNPGLTESQVESILTASLGAERILWLDEGYEGDETGGHVDVVAALAAPGRILHLECSDPHDPNHGIFQRNLAALEGMRDAKDRPLEVIRIPQPSRREVDGRRLSLSYLNFYLPNGAVILPVFADPLDDFVIGLFEKIFPARQIVPFAAGDLFVGGGGIHCVTQQQPRSRARAATGS